MVSIFWVNESCKLLLGLLPANREERLCITVLWCACGKLCLHADSLFILNL